MTPDELVDALQEAWQARRRGAFRDMLAVDVHWQDPFCAEPLYGPEAIGDHAATLWEAFPDARVEVSGERLGDGRFIAAPVRISGTHAGELPNLPPTGRPVSVHAIVYCELDPPRQRLWRVRVFLDGYDAAIQMGVLPKRGSLAERALLVVRGFGMRRGAGPGEVEGGPPATR
ncbi:MAG TPA: ester cyclase [Solirubrobacteraceae bacterium]|nr:ester cyclase [Solirubrobacteraceae bacterium]